MSTTKTYHFDRSGRLVSKKMRSSQHLVKDDQRMQALKWRLKQHSRYQRIPGILVRSPGDMLTKAQVRPPLC